MGKLSFRAQRERAHLMTGQKDRFSKRSANKPRADCPSEHSGSTGALPRRPVNVTSSESADGKFLGPVRYAYRTYESGILCTSSH